MRPRPSASLLRMERSRLLERHLPDSVAGVVVAGVARAEQRRLAAELSKLPLAE